MRMMPNYIAICISKLRSKISLDVLGDAVISLSVNVVGKGLTLFTAIFVGRALGLEAFGLYGAVVSFAMILSIVFSVGMPQYFVLEGSRLYAASNVAGFRDLLSRLSRWAVLHAIAGICLVLAGYWFFVGMFEPGLNSSIVLGGVLILLPINILGLFRQQALRSMRRIVSFRFSETIVLNIVVLVVVLNFAGTAGNEEDLSHVGLLARILGAVGALLFGYVLLRHAIRSWDGDVRLVEDRQKSTIHYERGFQLKGYRSVVKVSSRLMVGVLSLKYLGVLDVAMLSLYSTASEVGNYYAATRIAVLMGFGLTAVNQILAPLASRSVSVGKHGSSSLALTAVGISGCIAVAVLVMLVQVGDVVSKVFGAEFGAEQNVTVLYLVVGAQILHTFVTPLETILSMTGHENVLSAIQGFSCLLGATLSFFFVPEYGAIACGAISLFVLFIWKVSVLLLWLRTRSDDA